MIVERWAYLLLVQALIFVEAVNSLQNVANQTIITIQSVQLPESSISLNQSLTTSNSSIDNRIDVVCDALIYGASPNLRDCLEALNAFFESDVDHAWVDRGTGHSGSMFQLPFRMMGSKLIDIFYAVLLADTRYRFRDLLPATRAKNKRWSSPCKL